MACAARLPSLCSRSNSQGRNPCQMRGPAECPCKFPPAHQLEDAAAAIAFVRDGANARRYSIDARRIVLTGHSTGGLIAMITAAANPAIEGLVLISASDDSG